MIRIFLFFYFAAQFIAVGQQTQRVATAKDVSNLVDPLKLRTLKIKNSDGSSAFKANRFNQLMAHIRMNEVNGSAPTDFINEVYSHLEDRRPMADRVHVFNPKLEKRAILSSYNTMKEYGCLTPDNVLKLKKGNSAQITKGKYIGQIIHVDHIAPKSIFPELTYSFSNLQPLPDKVNIIKSNKYTPEGRRVIGSISGNTPSYSDLASTRLSHFQRARKNRTMPPLKSNRSNTANVKLVNSSRSSSKITKSSGFVGYYKALRKQYDTPYKYYKYSKKGYVSTEKILTAYDKPVDTGFLNSNAVKWGGIAVEVGMESYLTWQSYNQLQDREITDVEFTALSAIRATRIGVAYFALGDIEPVSKIAATVSYLVLSGVEWGVEKSAKQDYERRMAILDSLEFNQKCDFAYGVVSQSLGGPSE